ncbi:hypothetical protein Rs2_14446 [Raphanus sativus]|nr:hypothetical protein Rs2_14446 [Raphanus sativus]
MLPPEKNESTNDSPEHAGEQPPHPNSIARLFPSESFIRDLIRFTHSTAGENSTSELSSFCRRAYIGLPKISSKPAKTAKQNSQPKKKTVPKANPSKQSRQETVLQKSPSSGVRAGGAAAEEAAIPQRRRRPVPY